MKGEKEETDDKDYDFLLKTWILSIGVSIII